MQKWSPLFGQEIAVSWLVFSLIRLPLAILVRSASLEVSRRGCYAGAGGCRSQSIWRCLRGPPSRSQKRSGTRIRTSSPSSKRKIKALYHVVPNVTTCVTLSSYSFPDNEGPLFAPVTTFCPLFSSSCCRAYFAIPPPHLYRPKQEEQTT